MRKPKLGFLEIPKPGKIVIPAQGQHGMNDKVDSLVCLRF
jgi:hypothetical protein